MNRRLIYILSLCAGLLAFAGCNEEKPFTYEGAEGVYFFKGQQFIDGEMFIQNDSLNLSFIDVPDDQDRITAWVDVRTNGIPADRERRIVIEQTNAGKTGAAVAGTHFVPFDDASLADRMVMPAGEVRTLIPIVLKRDASLEKGRLAVQFRLVATDDFPQTLTNKNDFTVTTTAQYEKPSRWDDWWNTAFGEWGPVKMWFIVQVVGFNEMDQTSSVGFRTAIKTRAIELLDKYNKEHGALIEDPAYGGLPVEFPKN